jgi:hypothetical protein
MALPQGSTARGDLAVSSASAPKSWLEADDQAHDLTQFKDGYGSRLLYSDAR